MSQLVELTSTAKEPFDELTADIILRSSDQVDFYLYKAILRLASPFFKDMFSLEQPNTSAREAQSQSPPIIDVSEDSQTLDHLLRLCYPVADPTIETLEGIANVLEAALKYDMHQPVLDMKRALFKYVESTPLQTYVVACRFRLEEEALLSAKTWRNQAISHSTLAPPNGATSELWDETAAALSYSPDMSQISAGSYYRLICFIRTGQEPKTFCDPEPNSGSDKYLLIPCSLLPSVDHSPSDLVLCCSDGVEIEVHKLILSLASEVFTRMISRVEVNGSSASISLSLPHHSSTISFLLQFCYPTQDPDIPNLDILSSVSGPAVRYKLKRAESFLKRSLVSHIDTDPLGVYFIAARYNWEGEARQAAIRLVRLSLDDLYVPDMEFAPACVYHSLLKFHHECRRVVQRIVTEIAGIEWASPWQEGTQSWPKRDLFERVLVSTLQKSIIIAYKRPTSWSVPAMIDQDHQLEARIHQALSQIKLELST